MSLPNNVLYARQHDFDDVLNKDMHSKQHSQQPSPGNHTTNKQPISTFSGPQHCHHCYILTFRPGSQALRPAQCYRLEAPRTR